MQNDDSDDTLSREIELQATLQAERQQAALMRKALEEKERALHQLTEQCESLENVLEDREREMDHLTRKIEQVNVDLSPTHLKVAKLDSTYSDRRGDAAVDVGSLFARDDADIEGKKGFNWASLVKIGGISLILALAVGTGIMLRAQIVGVFSKLLQSTTSTVEPTPPIAPINNANTQIVVNPKPPIPQTKPHPLPTETQQHHLFVSPPIRDRLRSGGLGPKIVQLPAGKFFMGTKLIPGFLPGIEQPYHEVIITHSFYIASYETSFDEYELFAKANGIPIPNDSGFGRGNHPVINVTWNDAQKYTEWLSKETGYHYYLPSESQWEYAARAGTDTNFWWGNESKKNMTVCFMTCGSKWDSISTAPVGSFKPNPFGLFDTSGNVMEWTQDCHNLNYANAPTDGKPWLTGDCSQRIVRGGAFNKPISLARSASRFKLPTDGRFNMLGFRVARDL